MLLLTLVLQSLVIVRLLEFSQCHIPLNSLTEKCLKSGTDGLMITEADRGNAFIFKTFNLIRIHLEQDSIGVAWHTHFA